MCGKFPISSQKLMYQLGSFKPSDRRDIKKAILTDGGDVIFTEALVDFLRIWEDSDWLEDYNVERVAVWVSVNANSTLRAEISRRLQAALASRTTIGAGAYEAFLQTLSNRQTSNATPKPSESIHS